MRVQGLKLECGLGAVRVFLVVGGKGEEGLAGEELDSTCDAKKTPQSYSVC